MGQYWMIVSLDSYRSFGDWGQLGEFILSFPKDLENWLRPSPKLPDYDKLIRPVKSGQIFRRAEKGFSRPALWFPSTATLSSNPATLVNLPVELIDEIYAHIPYLADAVCLSATCQVLWEIGRPNMHRLAVEVTSNYYSWAGERVLCIGDYLSNKDIPDGILTEDELDEFTDDGQDTLYNYEFDVIPNRVRRGGFSMRGLWELCGVDDRFFEGKDHFHVHFCDYDFLALHDLFDLKYSPPPPASSSVLRNLTQKAYVRETALLELKAHYAGTEVEECIGFGEALMTRICLSSDPTAALAWDQPINRGAWAGNRFDIVPSADWHDPTWVDASEDVLKDVEQLFRAENEHGPQIPQFYL
ncbi:hypothetical protein C8R47DRAFT_1030908 [Mycena vitilis]|nr:hypothetical protein C8R47DRAFT_1030908 [Mycena vitilis]